MFLEIIIALAIGIIAGTITGLAPGIHVNLVSAFLLAITPLLALQPLVLVVFIVAMTTTHTFVDFIPSIFLGSPDESTGLAILPGHELLLKGKGYEAVILTLYGSTLGILLILLLTPIFIFVLPKIYLYLKIIMFFILLLTQIYLLIREKSSLALLVFLLSGFLGLATLNLSMKQSLLPLLTGLFGASSLITSISKKQKLPKQKVYSFKKIKINKKELIKPGIAAFLSAPLCSFLPALGSNQAAVIGSDIVESTSRREFLILLGAINTIVAGLSFVALYSIQEARTGTAVAVNKLVENLSVSNLILILVAILVSGFFAFFLTIAISKFFARKISLINYNKLSFFILLILSLIVLIFSGFLGFLVFLVAAATGLTAILLGVRRTNLMGSLMLPAILLYLPF